MIIQAKRPVQADTFWERPFGSERSLGSRCSTEWPGSAINGLAAYPDLCSNFRSSLTLWSGTRRRKPWPPAVTGPPPSLCEVSPTRPVPDVIASCFERELVENEASRFRHVSQWRHGVGRRSAGARAARGDRYSEQHVLWFIPRHR